MIDLYIHTEGDTEEEFIKKILAPEFALKQIYMGGPRITTNKKKNKKGGSITYAKAKPDILRLMNQHKRKNAWFSTMYDFFHLSEDFPGYDEAKKRHSPYAKIATIEEAMKKDISHERWIPYLQLHEFEALLLSDPSQFHLVFPGQEKEIERLTKALSGQNPEEINTNDPPSYRIERHITRYKKTTNGPILAQYIGLAKMREKCRHFDEWLTKIEALAGLP